MSNLVPYYRNININYWDHNVPNIFGNIEGAVRNKVTFFSYFTGKLRTKKLTKE